jgi:hypothetical protein
MQCALCRFRCFASRLVGAYLLHSGCSLATDMRLSRSNCKPVWHFVHSLNCLLFTVIFNDYDIPFVRHTSTINRPTPKIDRRSIAKFDVAAWCVSIRFLAVPPPSQGLHERSANLASRPPSLPQITCLHICSLSTIKQ